MMLAAMGNGVKKPMGSTPYVIRALLASRGAVLPISVPVPPMRAPMARGRYVFFLVIRPSEASAMAAIKDMYMATSGALVIKPESTAAERNTASTKVRS